MIKDAGGKRGPGTENMVGNRNGDPEFVSRVMREAAEEVVGDEMMERVAVSRDLLAQTRVDQLEVRERPVVVFRVGENTCIEAIVRYPVEPRRPGQVKTQLIQTMLERSNAEPERVIFPKMTRDDPSADAVSFH